MYRNFVNMKNIQRKYNLIIDLSKFIFNRKIIHEWMTTTKFAVKPFKKEKERRRS